MIFTNNCVPPEMAHRRKSSHPVCKTRRNLELTPQDGTEDNDVSFIYVLLFYWHLFIYYRFIYLMISVIVFVLLCVVNYYFVCEVQGWTRLANHLALSVRCGYSKGGHRW